MRVSRVRRIVSPTAGFGKIEVHPIGDQIRLDVMYRGNRLSRVCSSISDCISRVAFGVRVPEEDATKAVLNTLASGGGVVARNQELVPAVGWQ